MRFSTSRRGSSATQIAFIVNFGLIVIKTAVGITTHSQAIVADATHGLTDLISDAIAFIAVRWSLTPATSRFPKGFRKIESLGGLAIGTILLLSGMQMACSSIRLLSIDNSSKSLRLPQPDGLTDSRDLPSPGLPGVVLWLLFGNIFIKEWLYQFTMRDAEMHNSALLKASAQHHRIDSITGAVAIAPILVASKLPVGMNLDAFGGVVISFMILRSGLRSCLSSLWELLDASISDDALSEIRRETNAILSLIPQVPSRLDSAIGTRAGPGYLVSLKIVVGATTTIEQTTKIEDLIHIGLKARSQDTRSLNVKFRAE